MLAQLLDDSGCQDTTSLVVYVVETRLRPEEIRKLELTSQDVAEIERPQKVVAPRNADVTIGRFARNESATTQSITCLGRRWVDPETGHEMSSLLTDLELTLVEAVVPTDEEGEPI